MGAAGTAALINRTPYQIAVMLLFTVLATIAAPQAWADPFGPLLKNFVVLAATLALMAVGR